MSDNKAKISIIVPVYNVEKYLERSIESILSQSFKDFELFLVDDGSTDSSGDIIDSYKKNDKRIHVIHQKNAGAYAARNVALKNAKGEYVCFFDSDDYIDVNMLEDMYSFATLNDADLVISGFYIHTYYDDEHFITLDYIPETRDNNILDVYSDKEEFRKLAYKNFDKNMFYPPWNKLYRLSYLKNNKIVFPETYRDDFPFVISCIKDIEKVVFTKKQYYHFIRKRSDSETQKYYPNLYLKREEEHEMMLDLYNQWGLSDDKDSLEMISRRYIDRLIECMTNLYNADCELTDFQKREEVKRYLSNKYVASCIKNARPRKTYLKLMYLPIRFKNPDFCLMMARFINQVKSKNIALFSSLKTNR